MNILKDSITLTISKGVRSLVMMVVVMLVSRKMEMGVFGSYRQLITLSYIITAIAPLGIPTSVSYYYKNFKKEKRDLLITSSIIMCLFLALVSVSICTLFNSYIGNALNIDNFSAYLFAFCSYVFILSASSFIENLYISSDNSKALSIFNIVYFLVYLLVSVIQISITTNVSSIFICMFILEIGRYVFYIFWINKKVNYKFNLDIPFMKEQLIYCIPLGLVTIMQTLNGHIDKLLVSGYFNSEKYAVYSTGTMDVPLISLVTISLATVALPNMSKEYNTNNDINAVMSIWREITILGALVLFPCFFILIFYNKGYIDFLFSSKYFVCIPVFIIRMFKLPLQCTVFGNILIVMKKQKVIILNMGITIALNILFNIMLIPVWGIEGAALSGVLVHLATIILQMKQISKYSKVKMGVLLPYRELGKIFLTSFIVTGIVYLVSNVFNINYIIKLIIFGGLMFILCMGAFIQQKYISLDIKLKSLKVSNNF